MHAVAGGNQMLLVFVHETRPALQHDDDMEVGDVLVPAGAFFGRAVGLDQLRQDSPAGGIGDAEVAVQEEIAKTLGDPWRVAGLDVGELVDDGLVQHQAHSPMFESCFRPLLPVLPRLCLRHAAVQRDTPPGGRATSF